MTKERRELLSWAVVMLMLLAVVGTAAFSLPPFLEAKGVVYTESTKKTTRMTTATAKTVPQKKINLNTATAAELMTIPGIGEGYAARILEYREKNGPFREVDELMNIKGIGEKRFKKWSPYLSVD